MSTSEYPQLFEVEIDEVVRDVTFTANGEHLVCGSDKVVRVLRVKDGQQVATKEANYAAFCVAASSDGKWIAAGTAHPGHTIVWDATTYEKVLEDRAWFGSNHATLHVYAVNFSPGSDRLVSAERNFNTAAIWDIPGRQKVRKLKHEDVTAARYSPEGDRIATASRECVRVWDSNDGRLLLEVKVGVGAPRGLHWFNDHLFVISEDGKFKRINASTGSTLSEWPFPDADYWSRIIQLRHGKLIACTAKKTITFWDTLTYSQFSIQHTDDIRSIACSSDDRLLVITSEKKITVKDISSIAFPFVSEAGLRINTAASSTWKHDQLTHAEAVLSAAIPTSNTAHHVLARPVAVPLGPRNATPVDAKHEAVEYVPHMAAQGIINTTEPISTWVSNFQYQYPYGGRPVDLRDTSVNVKQYDEALSQYTAALSPNPTPLQNMPVKQSSPYPGEGKQEHAFHHTSNVFTLNRFVPPGYEGKHTVPVGMEDAMRTMPSNSKISEPPKPVFQARFRHYVLPEQTKEAIHASIKAAIRDLPLVLINTLSGRLCNKSEQAAAFESTPAFTTLVTSMTTHIDHTHIDQVVGEFYRYAALSHTWEGNEPLYDKVVRIVVYDLEASPTHEKLRMFCKIVRDEGFNWAWSDTCCIDKGDHFVLQEALVSMFRWYEGSAMTIIFLCDVDRLAEIGALMMSKWNSRGWTLQEYHASKVVRIYTKDWTPYLGLTIYNHKESPEIVSEMEKATGISGQSLMALRPGLKDIREKLRLASTRQTTRTEDAAYSLLGIFSMTLPVTYGEGDKALGRLLSQLLTSSGDTSILAWTGKPGSFNSCLPADIVVFSRPPTSHIPHAIPDGEMATITAILQASPLDVNLVARLYDELNALPLPSFLIQRMKLPCLAFKIRLKSGYQTESGLLFRAQSSTLGDVEIKTKQNLTQVDSLYLVHPWIDFLLDRRAARNIGPDGHVDRFLAFDAFSEISRDDDADRWDDISLLSPVMDVHMEFLARLRQPFGALLLTPTRRNVAEFTRIATESVIVARVQEITPATLNRLIQGVRVLDVL